MQEFIDKNGRYVKRKAKEKYFDGSLTIKVRKEELEQFKQKAGKGYGKILRDFMNNYRKEN